MDSYIMLLSLIGSFTLLLFTGVPLAFSLFFSSLLAVLLDPGLDLIILPLRIYSGIDSFLLLAIPGFMFAALMMNKVGITEDIVKISDLLVGRIRGGLAHINVVSSMLTGGISGSSTADVAGIGSILIPAMNQKGYDKGFSAALTAASSSIGSIIPPSILMIIYGAAANVSIGALFVAGYIPGILVGLQQLIIAYIYARRNNIGKKSNICYTAKEKISILGKGIIPLSVVVVIIGGILTGVMTATESSAVASVYIVLVGTFIYRKVSLKILFEVAVDTAKLTAIVMFCVGTATVFGWLLSYYDILGVSGNIFQMFTTIPIIFLLFVTLLFLFLGTFMDPAPAMLIFVPVLAALASQVGVNQLQMGILIIMALSIGKITPPYGISLLLACMIADISLSRSMKWTLIFFGAFCLLLLLIILFPGVTLFLPGLLQ